MKVCMMVSNDLINDPRVTRHAKTLGKHGYEVVILGLKTQRSAQREVREHYAIHRIDLNMSAMLRGITRRSRRRRCCAGPSRRKRPNTSLVPNASVIRKGLRKLYDSAFVISRFLDMNIRMARVARSLHADIYTSNDLDTLLAGVLARGREGRLIYDSHEMWIDMWDPPLPAHIRGAYYHLEKTLIRKADVVMTVNPFIAKELAKRYKVKTPAVILNCPENYNRSLPQKHIRGNTKVALYQGRYAPKRGLENLIAATEYFEDDVILIMRGYGELERALRLQAKDHPRCRFVNPVPMEDLVAKASEADVGVIPYLPTNLGNYYASPNKLFEYIQAGLVIAASNLPFLRKVLLEEEIGLTFDPEDPRDIAHVVNTLTREDNLMRLRGNVERAASKYNWEKEGSKLLYLYESVSKI